MYVEFQGVRGKEGSGCVRGDLARPAYIGTGIESR